MAQLKVGRTVALLLALGVAVGLQVVEISVADACGFRGPAPFPVDTSGEPEDPASAAMASTKVTIFNTYRGRSPDSVSSQCPELGSLEVHVQPLSEKVGYQLEVVSGEVPAGLDVPSEPVAPIDVMVARDEEGDQFAKHPDKLGDFVLAWDDGATDEQEPFEFELVVTPIDHTGQRGTSSEPILVSHPGQDTSQAACSASGPARDVSGSMIVLCGLLGCLFWRRRPAD
jgi:hypothetical protein